MDSIWVKGFLFLFLFSWRSSFEERLVGLSHQEIQVATAKWCNGEVRGASRTAVRCNHHTAMGIWWKGVMEPGQNQNSGQKPQSSRGGGYAHKHSREQSSGAHKNKHGTKHRLKGLKHVLYFLGKPPGTVLTKSNAVLLRGNGHHQTVSVDNGLFAALLRPLK